MLVNCVDIEEIDNQIKSIKEHRRNVMINYTRVHKLGKLSKDETLPILNKLKKLLNGNQNIFITSSHKWIERHTYIERLGFKVDWVLEEYSTNEQIGHFPAGWRKAWYIRKIIIYLKEQKIY